MADVTSIHNFDENAWKAGTEPLAPFVFNDHKMTYNQDEVDAYSCTLHGALTALSNLVGYEFTLAEREKLWKKALKQGARENWGWVTSKAVDLVRKYWNDNRDKKVITVIDSIGTNKFWELINKGYVAVIGGRINRGYWNDVFKDGDIDLDEWDGKNFGHVFCVARTGSKLSIIENYEGKKHNVYEITKKQLESLVMKAGESRGEYYYSSAYFFMLRDGSKVSTWAEKSWEKWKDKIFDKPIPDAVMTEEQIAWGLYKAGIFTKVGPLTQERFTILVDRYFNKS